MHAQALKKLISHWAGSYSYGIPVGSAASRLIAEVTISDIDQILLSKNAKYVRYSDDFRIFCKSEAEAYKYLTLIARSLFDNHGLTLQQNKTKIIPVDTFRRIYLKENENREIKTLSERFYELLPLMGIRDTYEGISYVNLSHECQKAIDELDLKNILREQINKEEPDIFLLKSLLRRLAQIGDSDALSLIFDDFNKFVPVIREVVEYLLKLDTLPSEYKSEFGKKLINIYKDETSTASQLEYSRMYILRPFTLDKEWNSNDDNLYIDLYEKSKDDFSKREILLAMGRSKKDFWFRSEKLYFNQLTPWIRRAFIYSASCLPKDEYKHWIRGIKDDLDQIEFAISEWATENPIG